MTHRDRPVRRSFDRAFYDRYYEKPATAVVLSEEVERLVKFVLSYLDFLGIEVASVLDVGCGMGMWKKALRRIDRQIEYTGIDTSEYMCVRFGWEKSTITEFKSRRKFDLVICQDVLQYLDRNEVIASVERLARLCREALYVDVPTKDDFAEGTLDLKKTDRNIHVRSAAWYRRILSGHFVNAGGGVFLPERSRDRLLAMERASS